MKVGNRLFLFLIVSLFLVSFVVAAPVKKDVEVNTNGYQIFYPQFESIKQNQAFKLHLHLSNISNGYPLLNTQADCFLHLYDGSGNHTFEGKLGLDSNGQDWDIYIAPGNFSTLYTHSFYIWCNSSDFGGEAKGTYEVTPTGFIGTLGFYLLLLIISLMLIVIGYSVEDEWLIILGAFGFILLGLFILLYGLVEIKDSAYTYGFGIITMMAGAYFAVRGALSKLTDFP